MNDVPGGGNSGRVEGNRNDSGAAKVADVSDFDRKIVSRLPLDIERVVDGVGKLIGTVVSGEGKQLRTTRNGGLVWKVLRDVGGIAAGSRAQHRSPRICQRVHLASARIGIAGGNVAKIESFCTEVASLRVHIGRSLVNAERAAVDHTFREAG